MESISKVYNWIKESQGCLKSKEEFDKDVYYHQNFVIFTQKAFFREADTLKGE